MIPVALKALNCGENAIDYNTQIQSKEEKMITIMNNPFL